MVAAGVGLTIFAVLCIAGTALVIRDCWRRWGCSKPLNLIVNPGFEESQAGWNGERPGRDRPDRGV